MKTKRIICSLAMLVTLVGFAAAQEPILLRYKLQPGQQQIYRTTAGVEQQQTVNGMNLVTRFSTTEVVVRTLDEVDLQGNSKITSENKQLAFDARIPGAGKYAYDSTKSERDSGTAVSDALNKVFERLDGAVTSFTITPRGQVRSVGGYDKLLRDVLRDNPIGAQFVAGGSEAAQKMSLTERLVQLPETPVRPGDTWTQPLSMSLPGIGDVTGTRTFQYEGRESSDGRQAVDISISTELTFDLKLDQMNVKVTGTLKSDSASGKARFDPAAGQLVSLETRVQLSGDLNVEVDGMVIPVSTRQTQSATTELLDELPE